MRRLVIFLVKCGWLRKTAGCCVSVFLVSQLCLCPATFSTAYCHYALSSFSQEIRLSTSLLCASSNTNFLIRIFSHRWIPRWLLTNTAVTSAVHVTNFWSHKLIANINKSKNSDIENFICIKYGERLAILSPENIESCLHFLPYLRNICKNLNF